MSTAIENFGDGLKAFLASSIPNLKLESDVLYFYKKRTKFNSYGDFMVIYELIVAHSVH
jgi:hypothetical protein